MKITNTVNVKQLQRSILLKKRKELNLNITCDHGAIDIECESYKRMINKLRRNKIMKNSNQRKKLIALKPFMLLLNA